MAIFVQDLFKTVQNSIFCAKPVRVLSSSVGGAFRNVELLGPDLLTSSSNLSINSWTRSGISSSLWADTVVSLLP